MAHIDPGKLAQTHRVEPGTDHGKPLESLGLGFERGKLLVDLIDEDEPCLVMLGPLESKAVASLLCQGFFADVHGELKPLGFHGKLLELVPNRLDRLARS